MKISLVLGFAVVATLADPVLQAWVWSKVYDCNDNNAVDLAQIPDSCWLLLGQSSESNEGGGEEENDAWNTPVQTPPDSMASSYDAGPTRSSSRSSSSPSNSGSSTPSSTLVPGPVVNDYPDRYQQHCGEIDQWSLTSCQCVSFVAWRISSRFGVDFSRAFDGETWSNANTWANAALDAGIMVNSTPIPGAIAQTDAGVYGHVAWVAAVDGNNVRLEEYNALKPLAYDTRVVSATTFQYIHIPVGLL